MSYSLSDLQVSSVPQVSVIIPAYNAAAFIGETLDSVFSQTFMNFEVVVVNDGSPDVQRLEQALAPYREKILYLSQDNRGPAGARNTGIRNARGKYIALLDSDDCWLPTYLASQVEALEETLSLDAVYCDAHYFGDPTLAGATYMQRCPSKGPVTLESLLSQKCQLITSCTVMLRQTVLDAGLFDERVDLRGCEDYDLWLRLLYNGARVVYQKKVLGRYRSHRGSLSQNKSRMLSALLAVYKKTERTMVVPEGVSAVLKEELRRTQAYAELEIGKDCLACGDFDQAREALTRASRFFGTAKLKLAVLGLKYAPRLTRLAVLALQRS